MPDENVERALAAYARCGDSVQPAHHTVETLDGCEYIVLRAERRVLAVYVPKNGRVARLPQDEWPAKLAVNTSQGFYPMLVVDNATLGASRASVA